MKTVKQFETVSDLRSVVKILESEGIQCFTDELVLQVHISNFIKARDLIIEWANSQ
jgi:hypothetical protein